MFFLMVRPTLFTGRDNARCRRTEEFESNMNKAFLIGNVGSDGELRAAGSSQRLTFRLATSERYTDKDGKVQEKTTWHNCVVWGPRAEKLAPHVQKGTKFSIIGRIENREYEKDGQNRTISEIVVDELEFLSKKKEGSNDGARSEAPASTRRTTTARASGGAAAKGGKNGKAAAPPADVFDGDGDVAGDDIPF